MIKNKNSSSKNAVVITLIIVGLIVGIVVLNNMTKSEDIAYDNQPSIIGQPTLGESDAPVTVIEFGDFACPSCKAWGEKVFPQMVQDYVDTGKVKFSYINVLFHGEVSQLGSLAAESVLTQNSEVYWDFHQALFDAQPENHNSKWLTTETVYEVASEIQNLDVDQLMYDLEQQTEIENVNIDSELVEKYKVQFTPSIMVNGTMLEDPFDYDKIKSLIEEELEADN